MDIQHLAERLQAGEDSAHQFKTKFTSIDHLAVEIAAFANSQGGQILIGVSDQNEVVGVTPEDVRHLNQWIANATAHKIEPPIFVRTTTLVWQHKTVLIVDVPRGPHKPYSVNKSEFWVKNGADKRRATREELLRLFQAAHRLYADEMLTEVPLAQLDALWFTHFYLTAFDEDWREAGIARETLLENLKLAREGRLTLAGLLLFGQNLARHRPQFGIRCTVYLTPDEFRDKEDVAAAAVAEGNLFEQYKRGVDFVLRNLHRLPQSPDFNAPGKLEVPAAAIREVIANALVHRDYFVDAPIQVNVYPEVVEVASPGLLPNTVTVENIKLGIHLERNPILLSLTAKYPAFGYTGRGRGSGIPRVLRLCREKGVPVTLENDTLRRQFRVRFTRPGDQA